MKTRLIGVMCALLIGMGGIVPARAFDDGSPEAVAVDVIVVRPACTVATILGSALFCVCLPFSLPTGSVKSTANALIASPGKMAFTQPVGSLSRLD